jgi:hypothetical protein
MRIRPHYYYILDANHCPVPVTDPMEWAQWFEKAHRTVKQEKIGPYLVSTVFLGLDHNFGHDGPLILFETMVFPCGENDQRGPGEYQERCSTWDEALCQHQAIVDQIRLKEKQST